MNKHAEHEQNVAIGNIVFRIMDIIGKISDGTKADRIIWLTLIFDECIQRILAEEERTNAES